MSKTVLSMATVMFASSLFSLVGAEAAQSARFTIRGYVPLICNASIVSSDVSNGATLRIDAVVSQSCNAKHQMSVRFASDADTAGLSVTYNGSTASVVAPGLRSFGQERYAKAMRPLNIVYSGGTASERQMLAETVVIEVTPL